MFINRFSSLVFHCFLHAIWCRWWRQYWRRHQRTTCFSIVSSMYQSKLTFRAHVNAECRLQTVTSWCNTTTQIRVSVYVTMWRHALLQRSGTKAAVPASVQQFSPVSTMSISTTAHARKICHHCLMSLLNLQSWILILDFSLTLNRFHISC